MFQKNSFHAKKLGTISTHKKSVFSASGFFKSLLILLCVVFIVYLGKYLVSATGYLFGQIGKGTVSVVSSSVGDNMKKDENGNINVLLIGYGGDKHAGGYLADSIMVASFNPKKGAVTMISVPRDMYVIMKEQKIYGRINQVYSQGVGRKHDFQRGADWMTKLLEDITGLKIPYYATVDFEGFQNIIDILGGIKINVPKPIVDYTYPNGKGGYLTLRVSSGRNSFSGDTALMYARSRHSTSDFSRSLRQQQIIKAIVDKALQSFSLTKIRKLYDQYQQMVNTNITLQEMLGLVQYKDKPQHFFSFGYTTECSVRSFRLSKPACFLYNPDRSLFGGASVNIPMGGAPGAADYYGYTQKFAQMVSHHQEYLIEGAHIAIWNGIDKAYAKTLNRKSEGYVNQLAVKLVKYGFNVEDTDNAPLPLAKTSFFIPGTGKQTYEETIKMAKGLLNISGSLIGQFYTGAAPMLTGVDLVIILGNDYLDWVKPGAFEYN